MQICKAIQIQVPIHQDLQQGVLGLALNHSSPWEFWSKHKGAGIGGEEVTVKSRPRADGVP